MDNEDWRMKENMIRKTLFMLFLLASMSFAAWQSVAAMAIITSFMLIVVVYVIGFGFGIDILTITAKDEIYQLLVLVLMIVVFFAGNNILDTLSATPELAAGSANMQSAAMLSINGTLKNLSDAYANVQGTDKKVGLAASQALSCNMQGMGYSVSGCGAFSMLSSPFSLAGSIIGFAIGELNAIYRLIDIALNYSLTLLLPIGIILRTFRVTRGAGGLLIGMAISMHVLLPVGILFVDMLGDSFLGSAEVTGYTSTVASLSGVDSSPCSPGDTSDGNSDTAIGIYNKLRTDMKSYIFLVLVKATLGPIVALLLMISGIRAITSLAGAEVDVSALGRVI